ncbi:MAG: hypothetical protein ACTSX7_09570 [Alphaproteobacteria bacterium]
MPNNAAMELEDAAMSAAAEAKAITFCDRHEGVWIRIGDPEAENLAYAIATNMWKAGNPVCERAELMDAVRAVFDEAADGECPGCADLMAG